LIALTLLKGVSMGIRNPAGSSGDDLAAFETFSLREAGFQSNHEGLRSL
jgi:hypothetical protein